MIRRHAPHGARAEQGVSISMVVLAMTIVAVIMLYVGTQTLNSLYTVRKKSDRTVGMAAGDSGIEKYRAALQAGLADETNGFQMDYDSLWKLVREQDGAKVLKNSATSDAAGMTKARVPAANQWTVMEPGTDSDGYWQLYDVLPPRYAPGRQSPLVAYIRAWATARGGTTITTQPRVFRVEYRPSYISDYQSVSDAPFFVKENSAWSIDGPIHSNGYQVLDWLARDNGGTSRTGIWFQHGPTCSSRAAFTTSQGAGIHVPGGSCSNAVSRSSKSARQISLLGVQDVYRAIDDRCGRPGVLCPSGSSSYDVSLGRDAVVVNGHSYALYSNPAITPDSETLTVLLDGDVNLTGALYTSNPARVARVTIATRRRASSDRQPQVYVYGSGSGIVGARDAAKDVVGIVTQGDVVLAPAPNCFRQLNVAAIAQSGSITVPPEFVTLAPPSVNLNGRACGGTTSFFGSFSGHGQFVASIRWPDVRTGNLTPAVGYTAPYLRYNRNLFLVPPPYFPTALPWAVSKVKDADKRCLVAPNAGDPSCE